MAHQFFFFKKKRSVNVSDLPGITICYRERLLFFFRNKFTLQSSTMMECRAPNINGILWAELPPLGVNSRKILTVLCVFFALQSVIFLGGCTQSSCLLLHCCQKNLLNASEGWRGLWICCLVCRDANLQCPSSVSSAHCLSASVTRGILHLLFSGLDLK